MSIDPCDVRGRFERALVGAGSIHSGDAVFEELIARYGEAHRCYHTLEHIDACLTWLDWFYASAERPAEVELALWFHDAVYDPRRSDNERRSADLARERLRTLELPRAALDRIASCIESTERHDAEEGDSALVVDLDLTILGASAREFDRFERRVRQEYAHAPELLYRPARRRVLKRFLSRPVIYNVPVIREALELRARSNLERQILA